MKKLLVILVLLTMMTAVYAMTKSDLIERIAKKSDLSEEQSENAIDSFFDIVVNAAQKHDPGVALLEITGINKKQKIKAGFLMDEVGHHLGAEEGDVVLIAVIRPKPDSTIRGRKTVRPHDFILVAKEHHFIESVRFGDGIRGSRPPD